MFGQECTGTYSECPPVHPCATLGASLMSIHIGVEPHHDP
jgi:hypothetical protein